MADEFDVDELLGRHLRQIERRCRRKYGPSNWSKAQILTELRNLQLERIQRFARTITQLGDEAATAARQVEQLNRVIAAQRAPKPKGKKRGR